MQPSSGGRPQQVIKIEQNFGSTDLNGMFSGLSGLLTGLLGSQIADQVAEKSMENLNHQILNSTSGIQQTTPASKEAISKLEKGSYKNLSKNITCDDATPDKRGSKPQKTPVKANTKECSVCKDEFGSSQTDLVKMPCKHIFHDN
mmetsp:Transcript_23109/g.26495  ORF Transcript_23109/g.26495 Transcript_23109/m.26495 type:complete len:145 (-) Transcript_23109:306-740(-)